MTRPTLIGLNALAPVQPERGPADQWLAEARESVDQLHHATGLIEATELDIWQRPTAERPAVPGRGVVGVYSDPTGNIVADARRVHLRGTLDQLTNDPHRKGLWRALHDDGNKLLDNIDQPAPATGNGNSTWANDRAAHLRHLASIGKHLSQLADSQPRAIQRLAHDLRKANHHLEQRIRRVVLSHNTYTNERTDDPWIRPRA